MASPISSNLLAIDTQVVPFPEGATKVDNGIESGAASQKGTEASRLIGDS